MSKIFNLFLKLVEKDFYFFVNKNLSPPNKDIYDLHIEDAFCYRCPYLHLRRLLFTLIYIKRADRSQNRI